MAEAIAERVRRYILDGGDEDLRRLLGVGLKGPDRRRLTAAVIAEAGHQHNASPGNWTDHAPLISLTRQWADLEWP